MNLDRLGYSSCDACVASSVFLRKTATQASLLLLLACLIAGCHEVTPQPKAYYGPTDPMWKVVADINKNNAAIPSLWAQLDYRATLMDEKKRPTTLSEDGTLLYRQPQSLLMRCKYLTNEAFTIGSNDEEFWVKIAGDTDTTWWGHYANLGKPCCKPLPIQPDLVIQVLGVSLFDTNFLNEPVPVMRFNNDADAYMFVWNVRGMDRWMVQKEIWYDRETKLPEMVLLFDENGRIILRAYLSKHAPLEVPNIPTQSWPKIARQYDLFFPENGTKLSFTFTDAATERAGRPRPGSFKRPPLDTRHEEQVDKDCGGG